MRRKNVKGGGVSIYVHNEISYKLRNDAQFNRKYFETAFIEINKKMFNSKRNIIIGAIYRPPKSCMNKFNDELESLLKTLNNEKKYVYIQGDFNVNTMYEKFEGKPKDLLFSNIFQSYYYQKLIIDKPTRVTENSATLLDNIYTNMPDLFNRNESGILLTRITDHYPIFTVRSESELPEKSKFRDMRNFSEKNISNFRKLLKKHDWTDLYNIEDANLAFCNFMCNFKSYFDHCFPLQKIKINYKNRNPWISKEIKDAIKEREKLLSISIKTPTEINKKKYKKYKNEVLSKQRKAERDYYQAQLELHNDDLEKSWKILRLIIGKFEDTKLCRLNDFVIDGKITIDNNIITDAFNKYFISVGSVLEKQLGKSQTDPLSYVDTNEQALRIPQIVSDEIQSVISKLNNSSPGCDDIPPKIGKLFVDQYIEPLKYLINKSIAQGIFPDELKLAQVVPIFKAGDEQLVQNYRPISVLPFISKIYEKIVANYLIDFLDSNNLLYKYQFGFRKSHSTSHAIITLVDKVSRALDTGKFVVGLYLDIKKAFDAVPHSILLEKLYALGIRGNIYNWFKSYLENRKQYVIYNNCKSDMGTITHGVPQGSILGPLLFIIFMNDFSKSSELLFAILYADDTNIFLEGNSYNKTILELNTELLKIESWLVANRLTLNVSKTHYMIFHRSRIKTVDHDLILNGNVVKRVTSTKFLGIIVDDQLKWKQHINYIKNKISKSIGIIYKARNYVNRHTLRNLYYTFVYPYLIYCVEVWGNTCDSYLEPLILKQKQCIRTITFSQFKAHTEPLFQELNILSFHKLVIHRISLLMYKNYADILPTSIASLFIRNDVYHDHYTRVSSLLHVPVGHTGLIYKTFRFSAIKIWNYVEANVSINSSYTSFKNAIKCHLLGNNVNNLFRSVKFSH